MTSKRWTGSIALAALACCAAGCAINPATGKRQLMLVSEAQELALGRETDPVVEQQMGLYGGEELQQYVNGIGQKLASVSERAELEWTFRVVDDPAVNAFALPGGFIYITRGILAHLNSEAELATVMGHEIGHVTARHGASQMSKQQLAQVGLGLGTVLGPAWARSLSGLAGQGVGLMFLKFGRDDERQADELGLRYLVKTGYDARPAPGVFDILEQVGAAAGGERVPGWMSTHPAPENREASLEAQVAALGIDFGNARIGRDDYLAHLEGMVFGDDPRNGFFEGQRFHHPELAFRVDFPEGWKTINGREAVSGISPDQDAVVQIVLAQEATPQQALDKFMSQEGLQAGQPWHDKIGEYPAASRSFRATTEQGALRGIVAFLRHGDKTYRLIGYAAEAQWGARTQAVEASLASFARETDPAKLKVEPAKLHIVETKSRVSITRFAETSKVTVPLATLALLNHVAPDATLEPGRYKVVTGGR
jgi:predicted Zn-dependent protease